MMFQPDAGAVERGPMVGPEMRATLTGLIRQYRQKTGWPVVIVAPDGTVVGGTRRAGGALRGAAGRAHRAQALQEALRWGEPTVMCGAEGELLWAMPLMVNQQLTGGLVVGGGPLQTPAESGALDRPVREGCRLLREMVEAANVTNAAVLRERREQARWEQERAEALHGLKDRRHDDIRGIYLREEPALLAAIRRGERREARAVINRVLAVIHDQGMDQPELVKSMALELVVMMTRAAVQAGGDPQRVLGINYQSLIGLTAVRDGEELAAWLSRLPGLVIDGIEASERHPHAVQLARAIDYMESHLAQRLPRAEVARAAGLSPSRFSHLMQAKLGLSFTTMLTRMRLDRACHLLIHTQQDLAGIALACGFGDQSYFCRVFRRHHGYSPSEYRAERHHRPKE